MERFFRKYHRLASLIAFCPLLITTSTGIMLLNRSRWEWVQPSRTSVQPAQIELHEMIPPQKLESITNKNGLTSEKIKSIIYRPSQNVVSIRTDDGSEWVFKASNGEFIKKGAKRSTWLIELHEGTFWGKNIRDFIFLPSAVILFFLIISGMFLSYKYYVRKIN